MICGTDITGIADFLVLPVGCFYYFYLVFGLSLWAIVSWVMMKAEEDQVSKGDFISTGAISSIAVLILMVFGTLVENVDGFAMIQTDILMYFLALCVALNIIWYFKD